MSKWRVNGEIVEVDEALADVAEVRPGVVSVLLQGKSYLVHAGLNNDVAINGAHWSREIEDPRDKHAGADAGAAQMREIKAAMPGKVVRILVQPGDAVEQGQGLLILEAMKMQNEVRAPRSGMVETVRVRDAAAVSQGDVMITLE